MPRTPAVLEPTDARGPRPTTRPLREPQALTPALRIRRAVTLVVLTLLVPGSAQIAAGNRRLGRNALRVWLGVLGVAALAGLAYLFKRSLLVTLGTSPAALTLLALVLFALALGWPLLFLDAWRLGRPHLLARGPRIWVSALTVVLMLAASVPLVGAGRRAWAFADFIDGVFGSGRAAGASEGRLNVLLMGGDAAPDRPGIRPDSLTLVSIDADTGRAVLFSLPRNLENVPFEPGSAAASALPNGWDCGDECLLNGIYTWGQEHRDLFPGEADPGAAAMKQAVAGVTGLEVPYYVLIDLRGFNRLIDALGGITLTVNQRVPIGGGTSRVSGWIEPGSQRLDGYHALWYARSRHGASDYERMARQRCVMDAMLHQLDPASVLFRFQGIATAGRSVVSTDIPAGQFDTFIELAVRAKSQKISSVQFVPPLINPARPDLGLIRDKVDAAIEASEKARSAAASVPASPTRRPADASSPAPQPAARAASPAVSPAASPAASPPAEASDVSEVCGPA